jgi:hypothetical protein
VAKTFDPCEHFEKAPTPRRLKKGFSIVLLAVEAFHQDLWTTAAGIVYVLFSILGGRHDALSTPLSLGGSC